MNHDEAQILRIAVPSDEPGGLDAARSGHFGRSPCFTIVDLIDDVMVNVLVVPNARHGKGDGCITPVLILGENLVDVVSSPASAAGRCSPACRPACASSPARTGPTCAR